MWLSFKDNHEIYPKKKEKEKEEEIITVAHLHSAEN